MLLEIFADFNGSMSEVPFFFFGQKYSFACNTNNFQQNTVFVCPLSDKLSSAKCNKCHRLASFAIQMSSASGETLNAVGRGNFVSDPGRAPDPCVESHTQFFFFFFLQSSNALVKECSCGIDKFDLVMYLNSHPRQHFPFLQDTSRNGLLNGCLFFSLSFVLASWF